jgi:hypothetical protein
MFVFFISQRSKQSNALNSVIFHFALDCAMKEAQGNKLLEMKNLNQMLIYANTVIIY